MNPATVRAFYALLPPPALLPALGELARELARRAHGRPVPAENLHLTLAFVGTWPVAQLATLLAAGETVDAGAMRIVLDTQGGFRRAGTAWIAPSSPPRSLPALARAMALALAANGIANDERPFHPHMTLARRCRGPYPRDAVGPFAWQIDSIALIGSQTRAEGAHYTRLATWPLRVRS